MTVFNQCSTTIPLCTALLIIWFNNVKAFFVSQHQPVTDLMRDFMKRTSSSPFLQIPRTFCSNLPKILSSPISFKNSFLSMSSIHRSTYLSSQTSLPMASYLGDLGKDRRIWKSSPLTPFQSWYSILDPRLKSPVYNEFSADFSFASPQDNWPPMCGGNDPYSCEVNEEMFYIESEQEDEEENLSIISERGHVQDDIYIISEGKSLWQALYRLMCWVERQGI